MFLQREAWRQARLGRLVKQTSSEERGDGGHPGQWNIADDGPEQDENCSGCPTSARV